MNCLLMTDEDVAWAVPRPQPSRIPVSGATARDCEKAINTIRITFQLARSLLRDTLDKLNENLPVTATIDYADQDNLLIDMEGDLIGKLANAAEQV